MSVVSKMEEPVFFLVFLSELPPRVSYCATSPLCAKNTNNGRPADSIGLASGEREVDYDSGQGRLGKREWIPEARRDL